MPIPLPTLDDRGFDDLVGEARSLLPALLPDWTDHNPSDPGIALVELLAWLTEMLIFQVDQVPDAHTDRFLALLGRPREPGVALPAAIRAAVLALREPYRAVTPLDHEELVRSAWPAEGGSPVARVHCVPGRDLAATDPATRAAPAPAVVSVLVLPPRSADEPPVPPVPDPALLTDLAAFFEPRRLLGTRLRVAGPRYLPVGIGADLVLAEDADPTSVLTAARAALDGLLDPLTGGPDGTGWPFGRPVWASEVCAVLDGVALVAHVENLTLTCDRPGRLRVDETGAPTGVALEVDELVLATTGGLAGWTADGRPVT